MSSLPWSTKTCSCSLAGTNACLTCNQNTGGNGSAISVFPNTIGTGKVLQSDSLGSNWAYPVPVNLLPEDEQYEYKLVDLTKLETVLEQLNEHGRYGWELCATWGPQGTYGILKKKKEKTL